jgi:hypothetical protein
MININILKDINASKRNNEKENQNQKSQKVEKSSKSSSDENDSHFNFANYVNFALANSTLKTSFHSLMKSVIYNSNCSQSLTFNKTRFVDEIESADDLIKISNNHMQIERYEIMLVCER